MQRVLGIALAAAGWLVPPPALPVPSRSGSEGPPRPLTAEPPAGPPPPPPARRSSAPRTAHCCTARSPPVGSSRGISDGVLLVSADPQPARSRSNASAPPAPRSCASLWTGANWCRPTRLPASTPPIPPTPPTTSRASTSGPQRGGRRAAADPGGLPRARVRRSARAAGRTRTPAAGRRALGAARAFAEALARRYDGGFPDPRQPDAPCPRFGYFQAWNEPNLARYLEPQWVVADGRWTAFSPLLYRQLLNAFYAGRQGRSLPTTW